MAGHVFLDGLALGLAFKVSDAFGLCSLYRDLGTRL